MQIWNQVFATNSNLIKLTFKPNSLVFLNAKNGRQNDFRAIF